MQKVRDFFAHTELTGGKLLSAVLMFYILFNILLTGDCVKAGLSAAVQAHGLDVDGCHGDDVGALLSVEVVEVGGVLEVVCQNSAVFNDVVGNDVVAVGLDIKGDVLLGEDLLCDLEDLRVRSYGRCDGNGSACEGCVINGAVKAVGGVIDYGDYASVVLFCNEVCYLLALESALSALTASVFSLPSLTARMFAYAEEEPSLNRESLTGLRPAFIA